MFETDPITTLATRRLARTVFGALSIAGAAVFVLNALAEEPFPSTAVLGGIWILAFAGACVAGFRRPVSLERAHRLFGLSVVLPSIGLALLLPLTIQLPFVVAAGGSDSFDGWVSLSLWITGAVHIVLAVLVAVRAEMLVSGRQPLSVGLIYGACVGTSCIPFAVFVLPPFLVALTGLPMIPLLYYQARLVERERAMIATPYLPRAMVMT